MSEGRARTTIEGEHFVHKELWNVVERQLEHAKANPKGSFFDNLAAVTFASLFMEGYLNFIGELLAPDYWKNERKHFSQSGFIGKLAKVVELTEVAVDRTKRPFSTVRELQSLRDRIVHSKPEMFRRTVLHAADKLAPLYKAPLDQLLTPRKVKMFVDDVRALTELIHVGARKRGHSAWLGTSPFGGITMHASGHTELASTPATSKPAEASPT